MNVSSLKHHAKNTEVRIVVVRYVIVQTSKIGFLENKNIISCVSAVGIATGSGMDDRGVGVRFPLG
jgi:hypothetical protein